MIKKIINKIKKIANNTSNEELTVQAHINAGLKVGKNVYGLINCTIDHGHCWLIEIGDNVLFAPQVYLLTHDTSTKRSTGYVRVGKIKIGENCFLGARVFVMPGVELGKNCIVGACSVVTKSFPENSVVAGNPAKFICTVQEYEDKIKNEFANAPRYSTDYYITKITEERKQKMIDEIETTAFVL